ncbi:hypothetical protein [Nocardiopsis sp. FIRDI 009]|uniref:hypothetical protein n=1 Tax=Nocardiopsis sp. FIRDI 009 TaxID=714197 RepID=UPI0013002561|nr:hypothetical protein [Nocardiopsis sp. FIRDI 009]
MALDRQHILGLAYGAPDRPERERETVDFRFRGIDAVAVCQPDDEQRRLRAAQDRTLVSRLGVFEVLQTLPLGAWIPVDSLTARERAILPAVPRWALQRRNRHVLRLADVPVDLELVVVPGENWQDALDRARHLGPAARRMAVCDSAPGDPVPALLEADYHCVGLAVVDGSRPRTLVEPPPRSSDAVAALRWRLAEHVYMALRERELTCVSSTAQPSSEALRVP